MIAVTAGEVLSNWTTTLTGAAVDQLDTLAQLILCCLL